MGAQSSLEGHVGGRQGEGEEYAEEWRFERTWHAWGIISFLLWTFGTGPGQRWGWRRRWQGTLACGPQQKQVAGQHLWHHNSLSHASGQESAYSLLEQRGDHTKYSSCRHRQRGHSQVPDNARLGKAPEAPCRVVLLADRNLGITDFHPKRCI